MLSPPAARAAGAEFMARSDVDFMQQALELAETARASGEVPVGAVLVKNDEVSPAATTGRSRHTIRVLMLRSKRCARAAQRSAAIASPIRFSTLRSSRA